MIKVYFIWLWFNTLIILSVVKYDWFNLSEELFARWMFNILIVLFVFIIIYFVDYITYINGILYSGNSALPSLKTPTPPLHHLPKIKNPNMKRSIKKRK